MLTLLEILSIIIIHWFADFLMQDEKWANNKSKDWNALIKHTVTYSVCFTIIIQFFFLQKFSFNHYYLMVTMLFFLITLVSHTATDYFTSRIVAKKFSKKQYGTSIPNTGGFTIIGIDQVIHYAQLFLTYLYLIDSK